MTTYTDKDGKARFQWDRGQRSISKATAEGGTIIVHTHVTETQPGDEKNAPPSMNGACDGSKTPNIPSGKDVR